LLPILLADRVHVVEGIMMILCTGISPNVFTESGWKADWKYNKKGLIAKIALRVAIISAPVILLRQKNNKKKLW
jgi:hypothetical protein